MKILVYDIAASKSGALSVLEGFYNQVKTSNSNIEWTFLLSTPKLPETENIRVLRFPWVKKNILYRLYFENVYVQKLLKESSYDLVLSLQNIRLKRTKLKQIIYVHQAIPFSDYSLKDESIFHRLYLEVIKKRIFSSINKADRIIFQNHWMKNQCVKQLGVNSSRISVARLSHNIPITYYRGNNYLNYRNVFFYPATAEMKYKNHMVVLEAGKILKEQGYNNYKIIFTIREDENKYTNQLFKYSLEHNLNVDFIGFINKNEVFEYYLNSTLIFPSFVETVGLPLLEAKELLAPIIASDYQYAKDTLGDYSNVAYFDPKSAVELSEIMKTIITTDPTPFSKTKYSKKSNKRPMTILEIVLENLKSEGEEK